MVDFGIQLPYLLTVKRHFPLGSLEFIFQRSLTYTTPVPSISWRLLRRPPVLGPLGIERISLYLNPGTFKTSDRLRSYCYAGIEIS